jgi:hypothetical protein
MLGSEAFVPLWFVGMFVCVAVVGFLEVLLSRDGVNVE